MNRAVCVGINDYPGSANDLYGCINDARDWGDYLAGRGFEVKIILDAQATKQNIKNELSDLIFTSVAGDVIVFTYSGHGTNVLDYGHDEIDGYDEALYVYDGVLRDDELRIILDSILPSVSLVIICDSCFSGTVTRVRGATNRPKFYRTDSALPLCTRSNKFLLPEENMPEMLLSACSDEEFAFDALIDDKYNGAFTAAALKLIKASPDMTYREFASRIRGVLPSKDYQQTPQIEGNYMDTKLFRSFSGEESISPGCLGAILEKMGMRLSITRQKP
jgi:hypothetical protein